jgi:hypothetical protein
MGLKKAVTSVILLALTMPSIALPTPKRPLNSVYLQCDQPERCPSGWICEEISLFVEPKGMFWNNERVSKQKFALYLSDLAHQKNPWPIAVYPSADTPYGAVAAIVGQIRRAGIKQVHCRVPIK